MPADHCSRPLRDDLMNRSGIAEVEQIQLSIHTLAERGDPMTCIGDRVSQAVIVLGDRVDKG